jgi:hypothetical protein
MNDFDYLAIQPISGPIKPLRQAARRHYGSHPYFTRRAWNVVQEYIQTFSRPGDVVLDPFGGSGVTAVEPLVLRRRAIHLDISPLANFLCRATAVAPVDLIALNDGFAQVERDCEREILSLYTLTPRQLARKKIEHWYPSGVELPRNADVETVEELFTRRQLIALSILWHAIGQVAEPVTQDLLKFCFSGTLAKTNRTFLSARGRAASRGGSGIFSVYRYNVPRSPVELDVWEQFALRFGRLMQAKRETNAVIGLWYSNLRVIQGSATELDRYVEPESADYIYTDPPYGGHIAYLDLATMWNAWLGFQVDRRDRQLEVIEGGDLGKTMQQYAGLLAESVAQMYRALKFNRWLSVVFAHADPAHWDALATAYERAGFEFVNVVAQPAGVVWSMHKKKNPRAVLSGEWVLNFRKVHCPRVAPRLGERIMRLVEASAAQMV